MFYNEAGRYAWVLNEVVRVAPVVPVKGQLGLFEAECPHPGESIDKNCHFCGAWTGSTVC